MMGTWKRISTALGLFLGLAATTMAQTANQATADSVAAVLRSHPGLAASRITIEARSGQVTLGGVVLSPALKQEAVARTMQVLGVSSVNDRLAVGDPRVLPARFQAAGPAMTPTYNVSTGQPTGTGAPIVNGGFINGAPMGNVNAGMMAGGAPMVGYDANAPLPEGPAIPGASMAGQPGMPNYAWPSYAPYPNFSAVGYPTVYPWQAWPNIGPFHPYPEVPLDWRAVTLRWDDGLWWLDFKKHYTRPFFTPYPFGIFAY
jgi:hypothetical protein